MYAAREESRKLELENCSFVKVILMIIIVLYHSMYFWTRTWLSIPPLYDAPVLAEIARWFNSFHIYGFVFVSGYIYSYLRHEAKRYLYFTEYIIGKARRLLIPFFAILLLWVMPITYICSGLSLENLFLKYLLGISPDQLWFLLMLFGVFVIFWPLSDYFYKYDVQGAFVAIGFWGVGLVGGMFLPNVFQIWTAFQYIIFFWIGFKIRQHGSEILMKIPALVWITIDIALFAIIKFIPTDGIVHKLMNLGMSFLLHIIGAIMAFVVLQKIATRVNWQKSRFLSFLSKRSMPVYLFHQQVVYFSIYLLNGLVNPYLHVAINFAVAMAVSLLISSIMLKFKCTRLLIGEK